jgi:hypothetical protein
MCFSVFKFLNIIRGSLERKLNSELGQNTTFEKKDPALRHFQWLQYRLSISSDQQCLIVGFATLILSDFIRCKWLANDTKTE